MITVLQAYQKMFIMFLPATVFIFGGLLIGIYLEIKKYFIKSIK